MNLFRTLFVGSMSLATPAMAEEPGLAEMKAFATELKAELVQAMQVSPMNAVAVCNKRAPEIARAHSKDGLLIGRVSHKARSPENKVRPWMQPSVDAYLSKTNQAPFARVEISPSKTGLLVPILTDGLCLTCHGSAIEAGLEKEIRRLYPGDQATGFAVGDIRGFLFAEVDKKAAK